MCCQTTKQSACDTGSKVRCVRFYAAEFMSSTHSCWGSSCGCRGFFFFLLFSPQLQAFKYCSSRRSVMITTDIIITSHYVITQWTYCKYGSCETSTLQLGRYEKNPTVSIFQILLARYLQPSHTPWPLVCSLATIRLRNTEPLWDYGVPGVLK